MSAGIGRWTVAQISDALARDGYSREIVERAGAVQRAARAGCLLWTQSRLVTTDSSRIDARPMVQS